MIFRHARDNREVWYRYEEYATVAWDHEYDMPIESSRKMHLMEIEIPVARHTKCGVQLDMGGGGLKFVNRSWTKRYACPTREEARQSFLARKRRQRNILKTRLKDTEDAIALARKEWYNESEHREQPLFA